MVSEVDDIVVEWSELPGTVEAAAGYADMHIQTTGTRGEITVVAGSGPDIED